MTFGAWVLIVATHTNAGAVVAMQEFGTQQACEHAAAAARRIADDAGGLSDPRTWCVPKGNG